MAPPAGALRRQGGLTLVELLIGMTIAGLLSGMVLVGWFTLQDSYSSSVSSNKAREHARDAMSHMVREIRDARADSDVLYAVKTATSMKVSLTSSFNDTKAATDNANQMMDYAAPRLVTYTYDPSTETLHRAVGGGVAMPLVKHVVNGSTASGAGSSTPVFTYTYVNGTTGQLVTTTNVPDQFRYAIQSVHIRLLVDLDPGRSPVHIDLASTAQLRNMRNL